MKSKSTLEKYPAILIKFGLVGGLALSACGGPRSLEYGEPARVVEAEIVPEHTITVTGVCILRHSGVCLAYDRYEKTIPTSFEVIVEQCAQNSDGSASECIVATLPVDESSYAVAKRSDWIVPYKDGSVDEFTD